MKDIVQIYLPAFGRSYKKKALKEVTKLLPLLSKYGIHGIWLTAMWLSGGYDNGFDIIDYTVDPKYGTTIDLIDVISNAHALGIKVGCDIVPNHVSDKNILAQKCLDGVLGYEDVLCIVSEKEADELTKAGVPSFFGEKAYSDFETIDGIKYARSTFCDYHQLNLNWEAEVVRKYFRVVALRIKDLGFDFVRVDCGPMLLEDVSKADPANPMACMRPKESVKAFMSVAYVGLECFFEWFGPNICSRRFFEQYGNCYAVDCSYVLTGGYRDLAEYKKYSKMYHDEYFIPLLGGHDQMPELNRYGLPWETLLREYVKIFDGKEGYRFIDLLTMAGYKNDTLAPSSDDKKYDACWENNLNERWKSRVPIAPILSLLRQKKRIEYWTFLK